MTVKTDYAPFEGITFDTTSVGEATATLDNSEWSTLSGIREGYIITTDSGNGKAVITRDVQFQSLSVPIKIIESPTGLSHAAGNWSLFVPETKKIGDYAPRHIKSSLILPEYWNSLQDIFIDEIQDSIRRLRNIRRWDVMDSEYLDVFLQTMGMFFKSEIFDTETRRRFIKELPAFIELSGTRFTFNYLSFVVGALFKAEELWSKDYLVFIPFSEIPLGEESVHYPTNHIQLEFDADVFGTIDPNTIIDLFYVLASVPLVLDRINQQILADLMAISGTTIGQIETLITGQQI